MQRQATAVWNGTTKEGKGHLTSQSGVLKQTPYTFVSRFESGAGTNPEELTTTSTITSDNGVITKSDLVLTAKIAGITEEEFQKIAQSAKEACPVSNAYNLEITLKATLIQKIIE